MLTSIDSPPSLDAPTGMATAFSTSIETGSLLNWPARSEGMLTFPVARGDRVISQAKLSLLAPLIIVVCAG